MLEATQNIALHSLVVQTKGNIVSDMNGEKVMLSVKNGKYYNMGKLGGEIWDLIESPILVSQLVKQLLAEYKIEERDCEEQVISFLQSLSNEGLISIET